jgi:hypothetical protein
MIKILSLAALASISTESLAGMDRPALRKLYRDALGQPADKSVMDKSSAMRADLSAAIAQVESERAAEVARVEAARVAAESVTVQVEGDEGEKKARAPRDSKWTTVVGQLWALREGEEAVEVKIPVEKLLELGLTESATKHAVYWRTNPPGIAARKMGLFTSLRAAKGEQGAHLLIRKIEAGDEKAE